MPHNNQYALKVLCCQQVHTTSHKHIAGLFFLSMNISGTVMQETGRDVLKLTGCLPAIFKFVSMTGIYFKYFMCCCRPRRHMLYNPCDRFVLIQTRCPGNGH